MEGVNKRDSVASIDIVKLMMAIMVIAIHTKPYWGGWIDSYGFIRFSLWHGSTILLYFFRLFLE